MADGKPQRPQYRAAFRVRARAPDPGTRRSRGTRGPHGPSRRALRGQPPPPRPTRREQRQLRRHERAARRARTAKSRWIRRGIAIMVIVLLIPVAWSYAHTLQRPGTDSLAVRSVEWIRDNGGNGIVNTIERWWYTNNPPVVGGNPDQIRVQGTGGEVTSSTKVPTVDDHAATRAPAAAHATRHDSGAEHREQRGRLDACRIGWSAAFPRSTSRSCAPTRPTPRTTSR